MNVSLVSATGKDLVPISEMAQRIWQFHYVPIIGQQQVDYMLGQMYSGIAIQKQIEEGQKFYIIVYNNLSVGYMAISQIGTEEYMLHKFYIETEEQGRNIGQHAFAALLDRLPHSKKISLTVNRQNYKSINFYFKLGFKIESVADFDIGNGYYMNDFVMFLEF
ncbi:MAG: GNAT family N-acetyltransferase [Bacteroidota bacterium]|nr:GNAT family N-acetyltransferase [Bacteroidota bacterium]